VIVVLPSPRESMGDLVRRWSARGYALSNRGRHLIAEPVRSKVVPLRRRRSIVSSMFEFAERERT